MTGDDEEDDVVVVALFAAVVALTDSFFLDPLAPIVFFLSFSLLQKSQREKVIK